MRRLIFSFLAVALGAAPAALDAQTRPQQRPPAPAAGAPGMMPGMRAGGDMAAHILGLRTQLALSDAQVEQIRAIQERLAAQNAPLQEELQAHMQARRPAAMMRDRMRERAQQVTPEQRDRMRTRAQQATPEQRARMRERMRSDADTLALPDGMPEELRPVMEQLRENTQAATEQIRALLTAEQAATLRSLRPQPGARRGGGPGR